MMTRTRRAGAAAQAPAPAPDDVRRVAEQIVRLTRSAQAMRQHLAAKSSEGVEWSAYALLGALVYDGSMRASELAAAMGLDASTVSRQVALLVDRGLVERRADPHDGRASLLAATGAGQQLFNRLARSRQQMFARMTRDWPTRDVRRLAELLSRLNDSFDEHRTEVLDIFARTLTEEKA